MSLTKRYLRLVLILGVTLVSSSAVATDYLPPSDLENGDYPFVISTSLYSYGVEFRVVGPADLYTGLHGNNGLLQIRNGRDLIVSTHVGPQVNSELLSFQFSVRWGLLQRSTFRFRFGEYHEILLAEWVTDGPFFKAMVDVANRVIVQGEAVLGKFQATSVESADLEFSDTCVSGYEIWRIDGTIVPPYPHGCGDMVTWMKFEPGETKDLKVEIPTYYKSEVDSGEFDDGYLPVGKYKLVFFVVGYRELGLDAFTEFEIAPRQR